MGSGTPYMRSRLSISFADKKTIALAGILILAFAVYANTILNGFVYDDHDQVEQNPYVHSVHYIGRILTTTVWSFQGSEGRTNYYRPLMTLTYLLCNQLFQSLPYGFHLLNILLNCVVVWLVFLLGSRLFDGQSVGFVAAAIFALHPIHTEVVAWIAAITELQLAIFYLASFAFFLRLGSVRGRERFTTQALLCCSFLLALLSKEQAMTLLFLAVIYEHFYRGDRAVTNWKTKASRYAGLCSIGAAYLVFRAAVLGGLAPVTKHPDVTPPQLLLSAFALFGQYVTKLFWPHPMLAFYLFHKSTALSQPGVLLGIAAVLAIAVLFVFLWKHARIYSFALFWFAVTLAPVLNARWMATNVFTERYLYLPSVAFCWLAAGALVWAYRSAATNAPALRWIFAAAGIAVCALAATQVVARNRDWHDDYSLLTQTLVLEPHASLRRSDFGVQEWARHNHEEAERQWRMAIEDDPNNVVALTNLGLALLEKHEYDAAKGYLQRAIDLRPQYAQPHQHLAEIYLAENRPADAEAELRKAVEIYPLSAAARNALGKFYFDSQRFAEAETQYRTSLDSLPTDEAWNRLGDMWFRDGRLKEAEHAWQQVLLMAPYDEHAHQALGGIYFADGRYRQAEKEYRDVLLLDPANAEARARLLKLGATNLPLAPTYHP